MSLQNYEDFLAREAEDARIDELQRVIKAEVRAEQRRMLYRTDPLWRLSKLKDNRERRLRLKVGGR